MSWLSHKKKKQNDLLPHKASIMMNWADIDRGATDLRGLLFW